MFEFLRDQVGDGLHDKDQGQENATNLEAI